MSYLYPANLRTKSTQRLRFLEQCTFAAKSFQSRSAAGALVAALDDEVRRECLQNSPAAWATLVEYENAMMEYVRGDEDAEWKKGRSRELWKSLGLEDWKGCPKKRADSVLSTENEGWEEELLREVLEIGFLPTGGSGAVPATVGRAAASSGLRSVKLEQKGGNERAHSALAKRSGQEQRSRTTSVVNMRGDQISRTMKKETGRANDGNDEDYLEKLSWPKKSPQRGAIKKKRKVSEDEYDSQDSFLDDSEAHLESSPEKEPKQGIGSFRTARASLKASRNNKQQAWGKQKDGNGSDASTRKISRAVLGAKRRFNPPKRKDEKAESEKSEEKDLPQVPNVEPRLVEMILNEVMDKSPGVEWDDIAGLEFAKKNIMEAVVWPLLRPDIFTGLRGPPKGLLLFGPPGTGKTMIGKAIASRSGSTFFNISASSLTSKWVGEGEKMVRALFGVARLYQPAVIFIDEIDSLLTQRTDGDQEASRRIKTEFLVQMDGAGTSKDDRVLVVGATNRPQELDEAARRRLVKRLYIPLPDESARKSLVSRLMAKQKNSLTPEHIQSVANTSEGYSGSDMYALCAEAALGPVRELGSSIQSVSVDSVRPINLSDFSSATRMVRASVSPQDLVAYKDWNITYGSFPNAETHQ